MSECKICTSPIDAGTRRYGGECCNACAGFFRRSICIASSFECQNFDACLNVASTLGKNCRKCRFNKCIEIGMISIELIKTMTAPVIMKEYTIYACSIDAILASAFNDPQNLENYLKEESKPVLAGFLEIIKHSAALKMTKRIAVFRMILTSNPITQQELLELCFLCLCKLQLPTSMPENLEQKIKQTQQHALFKLDKTTRTFELLEICQLLVDAFRSYF